MKTIAIPHGISSKIFVMESGALSSLPEVLTTVFPGKIPWLVADDNTWNAAGQTAADILANAGVKTAPPYRFPGTPVLHPDRAYADRLVEAMPTSCVPVAVGSGVINDLVKCAAGTANLPYCCCPTAASVDGYTSTGAALSVNGMKMTVPCPAPAAIVADLSVLSAAPLAMAASGYADLFAKVTGGADWIIADTLGIEAIDRSVWDMIHPNLRDWLSDRSDHCRIFLGLAATGYAMQLYRDSRPASGAEHLMSHIWEMEGLTCRGESVSHGFKVGIGTIAAARLMEAVLALDVDAARRLAAPGTTRTEREAEIARLLTRNCYGDGIPAVAMAKFLEGDALARRRQLIWARWNVLRARLREQLLPSATMIEMLKRADCPVEIADIGVDREQFFHAIRTAQLIRKRYTILDLLYEAGLLEVVLNRLSPQYQ